MSSRSAIPMMQRIPLRNPKLEWKLQEDLVVLEQENTGIANRLAQVLFRRPAVSYIHLDEVGTFLWTRMDGTQSVSDLTQQLTEQFGEEVALRLSTYLSTLLDCRFIEWK